jgi:hypothetical protein
MAGRAGYLSRSLKTRVIKRPAIVMMEAAEDWTGHDRAGRRDGHRAVGNTLVETLVRALN